MTDHVSQRDRILGMIRAKHPGYHPLIAIADLAHDTDDDKVALDCHKTVARYIEADLKSIEVRGEGMGNTINVVTVSQEGVKRDLIDDMASRRQACLRVIDSKVEEEKEEPRLVRLSTG